MVKRKLKAKRSLGSLPKGLPSKNSSGVNPFEIAGRHKSKRAKHEVANRPTNHTAQQQPSALARSLNTRKTVLREQLQSAKKANVFTDRRIGEYDGGMTADEQNMARLVRERSRRSKRSSKFNLDDAAEGDDEGAMLTHKGRKIDAQTAKDHVILSDDEDDIGNLDAADTMMHFGGGGGGASSKSPYGPSDGNLNVSNAYSSRKTELDDLIKRRKIIKAEKVKSNEEQVETIEAMDHSFKELATLLSFRDKERDIREHFKAKRAGTLSTEDQEMADWDKEMKQYQFMDRKVQASDRTKTPEEIAKEESTRLHELETRRLARMNGDFDDDDFSDIGSGDEDDDGKKKRKRKKARQDHPEALDDSDDDEPEAELQTRMTSEGLVQLDKNGVVVKKFGEKIEHDPDTLHDVGARVTASYRATEQYGGQESWFNGIILQVNTNNDGSVTYNVEYEDGDFEDGVESRHVRPVDKTDEEQEKEAQKKAEEIAQKSKRLRAKEKARTEIPFVFEVPTTLEALHDMIGNYASTGNDASVIIQRIYASNSIRLDRRNGEKMQNFYDVLLRRFVAVADAIHQSGDGGVELGRFKQLDALTKTMYAMAQDSSDGAGSIWSRRLGIFQNAHAKRLRDAELERDEEEDDVFSAWPSVGVVLTLKALGHIFPVTDQRHHVVTPAVLLLGQMVAQTPVLSTSDVVLGTLCSGLLIDYTREAKRVAPEAHAFLAGVIRLFANDAEEREGSHPLPSLSAAAGLADIASFRSVVSQFKGKSAPLLSLEKSAMEGGDTPVALLFAALSLVERLAENLAGAVSSAEKELLAEITDSLLALKPASKAEPLPTVIKKKIASAAAALSEACELEARAPIQRKSGPTLREKAIKSLAPRLENPDKYSLSRDKGKSSIQAATDRTRREYRREHKAVARELRLDGAFIENERRSEQDKKDSAARAKRNKNFAWMESEQGAMNQQVRLGGELLKGGGTGAARAKVASAQMGIKKGGKF